MTTKADPIADLFALTLTTGPSQAHRAELDGNVAHQVRVVLKTDGSFEVIHTGAAVDREELAKILRDDPQIQSNLPEFGFDPDDLPGIINDALDREQTQKAGE